MSSKPRVVFFGTGSVAAASLEALIESFEIEFVITKARKHRRDPAPVEELAIKHNLPLKFASDRAELDDLIATTEITSRAGVIVDYGVIVSQHTIDKFPLGIINSHFSLLPEWRGADPITFAILSGQKTTGVSLMLIEPTLDTGQLLAQEELGIAQNETTPSLTDKLINLSNRMLNQYIPLYLDGEITPRDQIHPENATYSRKLVKADGYLDHATMTAIECERKIRAFIDWPKTRLAKSCLSFSGLTGESRENRMDSPDKLANDSDGLIITRAKVLPDFAGDDWPDVVKCADNTFLQILEVINPKSGRKMKTADYLRGLK
ncbi:methionyl-tRNA formyltransferase [Candidatus Saccharibacteria bacterium]|nr:methionyl-tRNA formyltransferase [Candidatus Saccharibacteria bacterium]